VKNVIKPAIQREQSQDDLNSAERKQARQSGKPDAFVVNLAPVDAGSSAVAPSEEVKPASKSEEFAEFKAGKRADHDLLPVEIQALYVENLDIINRMRELHLKLRTMSLDDATCPDSERYPFLKEIIALDKKRVENWDVYDHFIPGTPVDEGAAAPEPEDEGQADETEETSVNSEGLTENPADTSDNPEGVTEDAAVKDEQSAPVEVKPKKAKATAKRTTKKAAKKA
jgi:hypothetical protein